MTVERICIVSGGEYISEAVFAVLELAKAGHAPMVPMLIHALLPVLELATKAQCEQAQDEWVNLNWPAIDLRWIDACTAVLRLDGCSSRADVMTERAKVRGIPVYYSLKDCLAALPNLEGGGA